MSTGRWSTARLQIAAEVLDGSAQAAGIDVGDPRESSEEATTMWTILKRVPPAVAIVFTLAGFASAYAGSAYSAWVKSLYAANSQLARASKCIQDCEGTIHDRHFDCVGTCEVSSHEAWYRENIALSKYADRQWWLWGLGFPVAMIAAIFVSMVSAQMPSVDLSGFVEGSIILFVASAIVAMLMIVLQQDAFLPASILCAYLLARTSAAMTGSNRAPTEKFRPPVFRLLLIGIPAGVVLGLVITLALPSFSRFAGIEVAWGLVFGASLALPATARMPYKRLSRFS